MTPVYKIVGKLVEKWCCAFYYPRMKPPLQQIRFKQAAKKLLQKLDRSSTFCVKAVNVAGFNYRPKANLFCSKWRNSCVWRDSRVIWSSQESVFTQLATVNLICYKVWFVGNKARSIAFGLVLQQFVARLTVPLASLLKREFLELGNGLSLHSACKGLEY